MSTPDGTYRLVITYADDHTLFSIEANLDVAGAGKGTWVEQQRWSSGPIAPAARRQQVSDQAREHGWMLPVGRWPQVRNGRQVIAHELWVRDHRVVVADVTAYKQHKAAELARADAMWRRAIHIASIEGRLGSPSLAPVANVTPGRVRQLLQEPTGTAALTRTGHDVGIDQAGVK